MFWVQNGNHIMEIYKCNKCFSLVMKSDRENHRRAVHQDTVFNRNLRALVEEIYGPVVLKKHTFARGMDNYCALCGEGEDHPNHV